MSERPLTHPLPNIDQRITVTWHDGTVITGTVYDIYTDEFYGYSLNSPTYDDPENANGEPWLGTIDYDDPDIDPYKWTIVSWEPVTDD